MNDVKLQITRKSPDIPVKVQGLSLNELGLLHALAPDEWVRNCASSMDENLCIRHRLKHVRFWSKGCVRELDWNGVESSYFFCHWEDFYFIQAGLFWVVWAREVFKVSSLVAWKLQQRIFGIFRERLEIFSFRSLTWCDVWKWKHCFKTANILDLLSWIFCNLNNGSQSSLIRKEI